MAPSSCAVEGGVRRGGFGGKDRCRHASDLQARRERAQGFRHALGHSGLSTAQEDPPRLSRRVDREGLQQVGAGDSLSQRVLTESRDPDDRHSVGGEYVGRAEKRPERALARRKADQVDVQGCDPAAAALAKRLSDPFDQSILSQIIEIEAEDRDLAVAGRARGGLAAFFHAMPRCYLRSVGFPAPRSSVQKSYYERGARVLVWYSDAPRRRQFVRKTPTAAGWYIFDRCRFRFRRDATRVGPRARSGSRPGARSQRRSDIWHSASAPGSKEKAPRACS